MLYFKPKVPKFELYKHNDELFNIYYEFFMNFELLPNRMQIRKKGDETTAPISTKNDP